MGEVASVATLRDEMDEETGLADILVDSLTRFVVVF